MINRKEGAAHRQANRSRSIAAQGRRPNGIIASELYERTCRIAGWIIGLAFGIVFALGIIAG